MAVTPRDDTRGIVHPDRLGEIFDLERLAPPEPVDRFVDRFWLSPGTCLPGAATNNEW